MPYYQVYHLEMPYSFFDNLKFALIIFTGFANRIIMRNHINKYVAYYLHLLCTGM